MTIRAVVFDIGGVLEVTPRLVPYAKWVPKTIAARYLASQGLRRG